MILRPVRDRLPGRRAAFTLLEVLVVVAIIVVLAGVGGYFLLQRYEDAKASTAKASTTKAGAATTATAKAGSARSSTAKA